nr:MAG TPA: hypothetical protein [Bacteriophage sp.]
MEIIQILLIFFLLICLAEIVFSFYKLKRNEQVHEFRLLILELTSQNCKRRIRSASNISEFSHSLDAYDWFANKYSYNDMYNSFKPLTLEAWYTEDELKRIKE